MQALTTSTRAAAQCAHAAVGVVEELKKQNHTLLRQWDEYGSAKIALKCPTEAELVSNRNKCCAKMHAQYMFAMEVSVSIILSSEHCA